MDEKMIKNVTGDPYPSECPDCLETSETGLIVEATLECVVHCYEVDGGIAFEMADDDWLYAKVVGFQCGNCGCPL